MPGFRYLMIANEALLAAGVVAIGFGFWTPALLLTSAAMLFAFSAHTVYTEGVDE